MQMTSPQLPRPDMDWGGRFGRGPVLACIDDGPGSHAAARVAGAVASRLGSRLVLATVQPAGAPAFGGAGHDPELVRRGRARLASAAGELDQPAEMRVVFGEPAERLIALAERERAELVVICAPSAAPDRPTRLGSAHLALARLGPCPVMLVPRAPSPAGAPLVDPSRSSPAHTTHGSRQ